MDANQLEPFSSDQQEEVQALVRRAAGFLQQGRAAEALPLLQQAYEREAHNFDAALNLGAAYIMSGRFKLARPVLELLRESHPDNSKVWINLGAAYLGNPILATNEQQQQAIAAFKQALELDPVAQNVAYNIALIYRDRKEVEEAKFWFRQAIRHNPRDQHARNQLERLQDIEGS